MVKMSNPAPLARRIKFSILMRSREHYQDLRNFCAILQAPAVNTETKNGIFKIILNFSEN